MATVILLRFVTTALIRRSTLQLINRASDLSFMAVSIQKFGLCDLVFAPPELWEYGIFDTKKVDEIYQIGYEHACRQMDSLLALLEPMEHYGKGASRL